MKQSDKAHLLLLCGALHDVAEKSREAITKRQLDEIRLQMQDIVIEDLLDVDKEEFQEINHRMDEQIKKP